MPVYADNCTFDTWEWHSAGELTVSGGEDPPRWPDLMPGPLDRLVRSETYAVDFEYRRKGERRTVTHRPRGLEEFQGWRPGTTTALVIRNDGGLKTIRRNPSGEPSPAQP